VVQGVAYDGDKLAMPPLRTLVSSAALVFVLVFTLLVDVEIVHDAWPAPLVVVK
jgi:hypothetical protein